MTGPVQFDRNAVVTVQGGGLYGLTLLGQMSAAISETNVLAIAGTSAGAIIAALVWSGWTPRELRDRIAHDARHRYLHQLPGNFEPPENPFDFRAWSSLYKDVASAFSTMVRGTKSDSRFWRSLGNMAFWYETRRIFNEMSPHYQNRGVFVGDQLEKFVEEMLREGLRKKGCDDLPESPLTFLDIRLLTERHPNTYFPPLILAATNVGTQNVELINSLDQKYERVSIARAVRASSGYPVFFRPVEIPELKHSSWFIDGGVISNFPAWVFSGEFREKMYANERYRGLAYRPWVHVGLRLVEKDVVDESGNDVLPLYDHSDLKRPNVFARALGRLMLGQARNRLEDLISENLARSVIVAQPFEESGGPENLFDFNSINERRVRNMFAAGANFARRQLKALSFDVTSRDQVLSVLSSLTQRAQAILDPQKRQEDLRIRSNVFFPVKSHLELAFQANMDGDSDIGMSFSAPNQGLTGFCYLFRQPLICNLAKIADYVDDAGRTLFNMTPEQQAMVEMDRTWLASAPIFDPNDIVFRTSLQPDKTRGPDQFSTELGTMLDGPVFGVLNVDANLNYELLGLDPDPNSHVSDARIAAIVDMMHVAAGKLGQLFGSEFASFRQEPAHG